MRGTAVFPHLKREVIALKKGRVRKTVVICCAVIIVSAAVLACLYVLGERERAWQEAVDGVRASSSLELEGVSIEPKGIDFTVDGGRQYTEDNPSAGKIKVVVKTLTPSLTAGFDVSGARCSVTLDGEAVFEGEVSRLAEFVPEERGPYLFTVVSDVQTELASGTYTHEFSVEYDAQPVFSLSADSVLQGDTLVLRGSNVTGEVTASVDYDYEPYIKRTGASCVGYIPVNHVRETGEYVVTVSCGGEEYRLPFTVEERDFEVQHLTVSASTASSTYYSSDANAEYARVMYPLFDSFDPELYWNGELFIEPVEGYSVTTTFGVKRFINDSTSPTRHSGMDMACAEGTPVSAPCGGKILFSGFLTLSGNTIVIEHGMGLHTVFMHMSELNCEEGDIVSQGDIVGYVGSTGFSTGPHLHFQLMVGGQSISPHAALDGTSGIYDIFE